MTDKRYTIGLFDSGVGGLSVLRQLEKVVSQHPQYSTYRFVYLGDTARCPYGDKDPETIAHYVLQITGWLENQGADCLVMACNTSAACAGGIARANSPLPVYDLIESTAEYVSSRGYKTCVLATAGTVRSGAFSRAISALNPGLQVSEIACPDLVPLVEQGKIDEPETLDALWRYVRDLEKQGVEAVILGCTHYPFLKAPLKQLLPSVELIDPAEHLSHFLIEQPLPDGIRPSIIKDLYVTGSPERFAATAEICLGQAAGTIHGVALSELEAMTIGVSVLPAVAAVTSKMNNSTSFVP